MTITQDQIQRLPWTGDLMPFEDYKAWVASRKAAGLAIDIETCELGKWYANDCDPYNASGNPDIYVQIGTNRWVRSPESNGWINEEDLPPEKVGAMYDRIHREFDAWARANPDDPHARAHLNAQF